MMMPCCGGCRDPPTSIRSGATRAGREVSGYDNEGRDRTTPLGGYT